MFLLLIVICGQVVRRLVKVIWTDFSLFIFMRHLWNHCCRRFMWLCRFAEAVIGLWFAVRIAVSSANVANAVLSVVGRSAE
jgi:hypothetical protein